MASKKHSEFSPSSAYRWLKCLGSVELSKKAPPQKSSKAAEVGTKAHELLEKLVTGAIHNQKDYPKDMRGHCQRAKELILSLRPSKDAELLVEQKVNIKGLPEVYGTVDYAYVDLFGTLVVIDFKYGMHLVTAEGEDSEPNPQLMLYAAALASTHSFNFEKALLCIIQPRVFDEAEEALSSVEVSIQKLKGFIERVRRAVNIAKAPGAPLLPGEHCRYCPSLVICPKNSSEALSQSEILFDFSGENEVMVPDPGVLSLASLPKVLDAASKIELWIEAVRGYAKGLLEDGQKISGYKLSPKRAHRVWLPGAEEKAQKLFGDKAFYKGFLSPHQLEKLFKEKGKAFCSENTAQVSSGFKLAKDNGEESIWFSEPGS